MATTKKPATLTIERRYRRGKGGVITALTSRLLLPPAWLRAAGFAPGDQVVVAVVGEQLVISPQPVA
ncbi:AbrB/MazE/SpoVT family DNA-binding domain-containing protein [Hymenobacter cheonanensis]|uniref:AbrB/MazE/SpoVT family DNA-binding domain-containing protein n=1 Tax=Hymenobacter sp. CA2-7 TaxID=3063993 RepID=UPI002713CC86|nr:AbrB/MazE/SpoVT family DNA-binding domain-containing protein [Hymenobacter sp. CA2-7]MDO7885369.1 type I addiction module toxin, SymE family [Hymenobacter sp. CA2-7]